MQSQLISRVSTLVFVLQTFSTICLQVCFADQLHLYLITQKENVGDRNQVLGLAREIESSYKVSYKNDTVITQEVQFSKTDPSQMRKEIENQIKSNHTPTDSSAQHKNKEEKSSLIHLALSVGESGIDAVQKLSDLKGLKIAHLSHQALPRHPELAGHADFIILPKHAVTEGLKQTIKNSTPSQKAQIQENHPSAETSQNPSHPIKTTRSSQLLTTIGVFHNLKQADLDEDYQKYNDLIPSAKKYIAVVLAGDAPGLDGKIRYFTESEAEKLAGWFAKNVLSKDTAILILNGPRTGKYDPKTGSPYTDSHRNDKLDPVTSAFINRIKARLTRPSSDHKSHSHNQNPAKNIALFDFQFDKPSYYKAVLATLQKNQGRIYIPGESTSMISEVLDNLPGQVIVYENGAMNETHSAHIQSELDAGRAQILKRDLKIIKPAKNSKASHTSPHQDVIDRIITKSREK